VDRIEGPNDGEATFAGRAAPPMTVAADTSVSDAVDRFQAEQQGPALVMSDRGVAGLLAATGSLETATGELEDPLDVEGRSDRTGAGRTAPT
jgi:CBS domain containing-hemolysin-like protein